MGGHGEDNGRTLQLLLLEYKIITIMKGESEKSVHGEIMYPEDHVYVIRVS